VVDSGSRAGGVELTSGTFYLLVYGVAAAVAGVAAWLGAGSWCNC